MTQRLAACKASSGRPAVAIPAAYSVKGRSAISIIPPKSRKFILQAKPKSHLWHGLQGFDGQGRGR